MMEMRVSDLKQYFYCPRIVYYTYCLPVPRPVTYPMQIGTTEHEVFSVLERRRSFKRYGLSHGERRFHVPLQAPSLGLTGVLDMLIITHERAFPVEFKHTVQRLNMNAKYQLVAYAMMVEECMSKSVECGFIYRILKQNVTVIPISRAMREKVLYALEDMRVMIAQERLAEPPRQRGKCVECEFRRYCRDVI
jgi:CRISPR-associated exonuclease Cas4